MTELPPELKAALEQLADRTFNGLVGTILDQEAPDEAGWQEYLQALTEAAHYGRQFKTVVKVNIVVEGGVASVDPEPEGVEVTIEDRDQAGQP